MLVQSLVSNQFFVFDTKSTSSEPGKVVRKLHQNIAGLEVRTACVRGWGRGYRDQQDEQKLVTAIFQIAANRANSSLIVISVYASYGELHEHVGFAVFGCRCRFAKP